MNKKAPSAWSRFLSYYVGQRHLFVLDTFCAFLICGIDLAFPQILRTLTGGLYQEGQNAILASIGYIAIGLVGLYLLRFLGRYFVIYWGHVMGARMESKMREDLFGAYTRMSFSYFDRNKSGDLMSRLVSDLFDISEAAHHGPEYILIGVVEILGSFIILSLINLKLTFALAVIACALIIFNIWANARMREVFTENRRAISAINTQLEDSLAGARVVKSFAAEDTERAKFKVRNDSYLASKQRMYRAMGRYQAAIAAMMGALYTVVIAYGGVLIAHGEMGPQDLATYALYISLFTQPISDILNFTETFQKAIAGFKRFAEVLDTQPDVRDKPGAQNLRVESGEILFNNVEFGYLPDTPVIKGLNLEIPAGKTLALVGPSGGGKSTTCALLPRFYDVDAGSITIDGQDIRDVTQKSLREAIGFVQQDVYLFDGTIADNIAYGTPDATLEQIVEAARRAHADEFINKMEDGYETQVGQRGSHLSGGQKQRIAIARVFLKNPPILIFDEATSALDNESEQAIRDSLDELSEGRTTLVIAHRLSTIQDADEIVAISDGQAVERGTHEELLAKGGIYAHYYAMQFGGNVAEEPSA